MALPIAGFAIGAGVTVADALSHDKISFDKTSPYYTGVANYLDWNEAVGPVTTLLVLYIIACLFSIKAARRKSSEAWSNFPRQNLDTFIRAQRLWAVSGFILLSLLIGLNVYVWGKNSQSFDAQSDDYNRINRLMPTYWECRDAAGRLMKYRFYGGGGDGDDGTSLNCAIGPSNGKVTLARFDMYGYRLNITSQSQDIGDQTYILSPDETTLTEQNPNPGVAPRVLRRTQQSAL